MPETPTYKFTIECPNPEGATPQTIVESPRVVKPSDLEVACRNIFIEGSDAKCPPAIDAYINYLLKDFFILAHRTGLYNRQLPFWQSIAKITSVDVYQQSEGFLSKKPIPVYHLHFLDFRERTLFMCALIADNENIQNSDALDDLLSKAKKFPGLSAVLLAAPTPIPTPLIDKAKKLTDLSNPVSRYESLIPSLSIPLDLFELEDTDKSQIEVTLIQPDLSKSKK